MTPVVAVVVTWNAATTIADALASIPAGVGVIVVDNASSDATVDTARATRPEITVVANEANRGFAAAANQGIATAGDAGYVLLLNPDAGLAPGALGVLVDFADATPAAAAVSALVRGPDGAVEPVAAGRDATPGRVILHELGLDGIRGARSLYGTPDEHRPSRWDWVAGTCVLLRTEAVRDVGPFDETFFLYCEDIDWCARARARGWEVWVEPRAVAIHGRSVAVDRAGAWVDEHRMGSLDRYLRRRHRGLSLIVARAARVLGPLLRGSVFVVGGRLAGRAELVRRGRQRFRDARLALALLLGRS